MAKKKRLIRDYTHSERVDLLSPSAECMFVRLMLKADDRGSYYGNLKILKSKLFPLKEYSEQQVEGWLKELLRAELLFEYTADGKRLIRIYDFGQRLRNMRGAFPEPDNSLLSAAIRSKLSLEEKRSEGEHELEEEPEEEVQTVTVIDGTPKKGIPSLDEFLQYCASIDGFDFDAFKFSLQAKYETWRDDKWKDGNGHPIKNWKTKIKNTIPYLKPMRQRSTQQLSAPRYSSVDEELRASKRGKKDE